MTVLLMRIRRRHHGNVSFSLLLSTNMEPQRSQRRRAETVNRSFWILFFANFACFAVIVLRNALESIGRAYSSRWTLCGEKAGTQTAMYSAPPGSGVEYWTHSPGLVITACPARTSRLPDL